MFATSSFKPVLRGTFQKVMGHDRFGRSGFSDPIPFGLSVIKLDTTVQPTSIRTDKSGSKSFADEPTVSARILSDTLLPHDAVVSIGLVAERYRVMGVFPRYDMDGRVNHYQIDLTLWR